MVENQLPDNFRLFLDSSVKRLQADLAAPQLTQAELYELYVSATAYGDPFQTTALEYQSQLAVALSSVDTSKLRSALLIIFTRCQIKYQDLPSQHASLQGHKSVTPAEIAARAQTFVEAAKKANSDSEYRSRRLTHRQKITDKINHWIALSKSVELKAIATRSQERLVDIIELAATSSTPEQFQKILTENIPVILAVIEKLPELKPPLTQGAKNVLSVTLSESFASDHEFVSELIQKPVLNNRLFTGFTEIIKTPDSLVRPDLLVENLIAQPQLPIAEIIKLTRAEQALTSSPPSLPIELPLNIFSIFTNSPSANTISKTIAPFLDTFLSLPGVPTSAKEGLVKKTLGAALVKAGEKVAVTLPPPEREQFVAALTQVVSTLGIAAFAPAAGKLVTLKGVVSDTIGKIFAPALALPARTIALTLAKILPREMHPPLPGQPRVYPQIIHSIVTHWQIIILAAVHIISPKSVTISGKEIPGGIFHWFINWATHTGIQKVAAQSASKGLISWLLAAAAAPITGGTSLLTRLLAGTVIDRAVNGIFNFGKNALFLFANWFDTIQNGKAPAEGTLVLAAATVIIPIAVLMFITSPLDTWTTEVAVFQDETQPLPVGDGGSKLIHLTKSANPNNLPNGSARPIIYTITIEATNQPLTNIVINDDPVVFSKNPHSPLSQTTLPTPPVSIAPGSPYSFTYTLNPPPNLKDAVITNTFTITADAGGQPQVRTTSASVIIGTPPLDCFELAEGANDPAGYPSSPWGEPDKSNILAAIAHLQLAPEYLTNICSSPIRLYRVKRNYGGGWTQGALGNIFLYDLGVGRVSWAIYTLAHETGHVLNARRTDLYNKFVVTEEVPLAEGYLCTYPNAKINHEDFAETIAMYVAAKVYQSPRCAFSWSTYPIHYQFAKNNFFNNFEY